MTGRREASPPAAPEAATDGVSAPLRVGLMLDDLTVPAWIAKIIRQLEAAPFTELALVIRNTEPPPPSPRFSRLRSPRRQRLLFNLYRRLDERLFATSPNAFAPVDMSSELAGVASISVLPLRQRFEHRFPPAAIERTRAADLDVLLRFGFNIIRGDILECARFGVWSYHHGDNAEYRGSPDFFWEMYERNPTTGTLLQVLTDDLDAGKVLCRSWSATDVASLHRGRNPAYWKSSEFVLRKLGELHTLGWEPIATFAEFTREVPYVKGIYRTPTNGQMVLFLTRLVTGVLWRRVLNTVFAERWFVAYTSPSAGTPAAAGADTGLPSAAGADTGLPSAHRRRRRLRAPTGRYYADPFPVEHDGRRYVFVEDCDLETERGVISVIALDEKGRAGAATRVLECPYHLSYPFVFSWDGAWYLLPESGERRGVDLYRATDFPWRWELDRTLLEGVNAVDATIVEKDGRFWLFANIAVPGALTEDELFLFSADTLTGTWTPHPRNPVVSDVRRSRPAGWIFADGGTLIRPSQDCSVRYGGAVVFNRITTLTQADYGEEPIGRIDPGWRRGNLATHTFNRWGGLEVIDGQRRVLRAVERFRRRLAD